MTGGLSCGVFIRSVVLFIVFLAKHIFNWFPGNKEATDVVDLWIGGITTQISTSFILFLVLGRNVFTGSD